MASDRVQRQIDRLLDEAEEAISKYDWEAVRQAAQAVLAISPDNDDAATFLASAVRALRVVPDSPSPIETQAGSTGLAAPVSGFPEAERRQLTVMFCDLQGSTALSQRLDPEQLQDVIHSYREVCAEAVGRFDGHIARYLGDGLLIYFGYPQAHEDDPQRAVRAGLAIVEEMEGLNTRLKADMDLVLAVRIGVHTGLVVAGDMGGGETVESLAIVGDTPNIAARLQEAAAPNTVVVSDVTANLIQGFFLCEAMGFHELKGIFEPMELFSVLSESGAQNRFDVAAYSRLTPLVGREQEVGLLLDRWVQVEEGLGQVVLISGEAGIGKSRLLRAINDQLADRPYSRQKYRCSPYHQNSALHPVIDSLERWLEFGRDDSLEEKFLKLEGALVDYSVPATEAVPLLAGLLSVPLDDRYPPLDLSSELQRQKTLELLVQLVMETASRQPVLTVFEDLHWADPTTLELLGLLVDQAPTAQVLALFTFRPEFTPTWGSRGHLSQITLNRLPRRLATDMIARLTGGKVFPEEVATQIATKSDGVPLFVEELTRMVVESDLLREVDGSYELSGPLPPLAIPSTLQDSLTARLDRLSLVGESVQLAAVLGREFSYELIRAVSPLDDAALARDLGQLVTSEFLYKRGAPPESSYIFKHALIQDAAFNSLLISRRKQYHQQVAQALEEQFGDTAKTQPELLAYHYTEAGCHEQAISFWQRAGQRAREGSAHGEAIAHLTKGLEILAALPQTPERDQQDLTFHVSLGNSLALTRGWAAPEVEEVYTRARELCQQTGETSELLPVLWGSSQVYILRADLPKHREIGNRLLSLAESQQDPVAAMAARLVMGVNLFHAGDCAAGREHIGQAYTLQHRAHMVLFGIDLGVFALSYMAHTLWCLGYPEQALHKSQDAVALAQKLSHPFSLTVALAYAAMLSQFRRQMHATRKRAEATVALSEGHGFAYYLAWATIVQGWVGAESGEVEDGMAEMQQGLAALRATGSSLRLPYYRALLAAAFGKTGHVAEGLRALDEAFADVEQTGERWLEAELHRLRGELLLQKRSENSAEAETCFQKALDIARQQQAKSWELRAANSLARLWQSQGKSVQARELLAGIYGWFTEGFDTPDLIDVKVLLEELS